MTGHAFQLCIRIEEMSFGAMMPFGVTLPLLAQNNVNFVEEPLPGPQ